LLFLVPITADNIKAEYKLLLSELKIHNPELLDKKRILGISKMDLADDEAKAKLKKLKMDIPVIPFSSATGQGLTELKDEIWKNL
jgi:GTP-binding protein